MPDRSVYREVKPTELIGTWKLTTESVSHLVADGYADEGLECTIISRDDSTVDFSSVNTGASPPVHQTKSAFWKITHSSFNGDTRVTLSEHEPSDYGFLSYGFTEDYGNLRLWNFHGDPDQWEFVEYTKVE